jgi:hypothetical protein
VQHFQVWKHKVVTRFYLYYYLFNSTNCLWTIIWKNYVQINQACSLAF